MSTAALSELPVAIQTVVFHIFACATLRQSVAKRRQKRENSRAKAEKEREQQEHPEIYKHPAPFEVNPHWKEDIELGPIYSKKLKANKDKKKRRGINPDKLPESSAGVSLESGDKIPCADSVPDLNDENWNRVKYQREDEALWGDEESNTNRSETPISRASTSRSHRFNPSPTPIVQEVYPPVVTKLPKGPDQVQWMLQPPPKAAVMEGKDRSNRSRSSTNSSRHTNFSNRSGKLPENYPSRCGQRHDRLSPSSSHSTIRRQRRVPPISISEDDSTPPTSPIASPIARPPLATIASSRHDIRQRASRSPKEGIGNRESTVRDVVPSKKMDQFNSQSRSPTFDTAFLPVRPASKSEGAARQPKSQEYIRIPGLESRFPYAFRFPEKESSDSAQRDQKLSSRRSVEF